MLSFNRLPDDRPVDWWPAQNSSTALDMLGGDIPTSVQVRVQLESARTTPESRLRDAAAPVVNVATRAGLRRVARVYPDYMAAGRLSFVHQERAQLRDGPTVQPTSLYAASLLDP